jgi:hypothetical protein
MSQFIRLERQKLYEEVWATPMWRLSKKYGLSDRGLAKICGRLSIPVPARGFWRRKETGQEVSPDPLPPLKGGQRDFIEHWQDGAQDLEPKREEGLDFESLPENRIVVTPEGTELHPLVEVIRKELKKAEENKVGILVSEVGWCSAIAVSKPALSRALSVLDALFRAFEKRGYTIVNQEAKEKAHIDIQGGKAKFVIEEVIGHRDLTLSEQKDKVRNPWKYRYNFIRCPSGDLCLRIIGWGAARNTWRDGKRQSVEDCLNRFMMGLATEAAHDLQVRREREREEVERKKQERLAELEERKRLAEQRKLWALLVESESFEKSQQIRAYVKAMKEHMRESALTAETYESFAKWVRWATRQADKLDPLAPGSFCTLEDKRRSTFQGDEKVPGVVELIWRRMVKRSRHVEKSEVWWGDSSRWPWL